VSREKTEGGRLTGKNDIKTIENDTEQKENQEGAWAPKKGEKTGIFSLTHRRGGHAGEK